MTMEALQELHHMVVARYALIAVESHEEVRFVQFAHRLFEKSEVYTWTLTDGIILENADGEVEKKFDDTNDFFAVLNHIKKTVSDKPDVKRIFILKDFHPGLESPMIRRALRDLASLLPHTSCSVILVSPTFQIPNDLEKAISLFDFPLPNEEELMLFVNASATMNQEKLKKARYNKTVQTEVARAWASPTTRPTRSSPRAWPSTAPTRSRRSPARRSRSSARAASWTSAKPTSRSRTWAASRS